MATNGTQSQRTGAESAGGTVMAKEGGVRRQGSASDSTKSSRGASGYGLPCTNCHLYYAADLDECPTCKNKQRVAPIARKLTARAARPAGPAVSADKSALEVEREEFLRQFKSQLVEAHSETGSGEFAACKSKGHRGEASARAEICHSCCERLQDRIDGLEAVLNMDLQEAAQIVYEAVWADPSNPSRTYRNAAEALLTELRKRADVSAAVQESSE